MAHTDNNDLGRDPAIGATPQRRHLGSNLWRLTPYLAPYKARWIALLALSIASPLVAVATSLLTRALIDGPIRHQDQQGLWVVGSVALAVGVVEAVIWFVRRWLVGRATMGAEGELRNDLYAQLQMLPASFHSRWESGQLVSRAINDLGTIRRFLSFGMVFLVVNVLHIVVVVAFLLAMSWPLGLVMVAALFPVTAGVMKFQGRYAKLSRVAQDCAGSVGTLVEESAVGVEVIKSFGREDVVCQRFTAQLRDLQKARLRKAGFSARFWSLQEAAPSLALVVVLSVGAFAVAHHEVTIGTLVASITLTLSATWPMASLGVLLSLTLESITAADRLADVFDATRDVMSGSHPHPPPRGRLELVDVGFRFPDSADNDWALRNVNLVVEPGQTLAVVGATGSGKSVLLSLLSRVHDPTEGRILLDGRDLREYALPVLRQSVVPVFEDPLLFDMTVAENLRIGSPDATDGDLSEAIDMAAAHFVYDLPRGLDTRIGEQGATLSGGQQQRLSIARALVSRPRILVLDDTLSALDVYTEAAVTSMLRHALDSVTGVVVAQRPSTIQVADVVALLEAGTVRHFGTHSDLLVRVPPYRALMQIDDAASATGDVDASTPPVAGYADADPKGRSRRALSAIARRRGVTKRSAASNSKRLGRSAAGRGGRERTHRDGTVDELASEGATSGSLLSFLKPFRIPLAILAVFVAVEGAAKLAVPVIIQRAIDRGVLPLLAGGSSRPLIAILAVLSVVVVIQAGSRLTFLIGIARVGERLLFDLRRRLFGHLVRLDIDSHQRYGSGQVVSRLTNDVNAIQVLLDTGVGVVVTASLTLVGTWTLMIVLDWRMGLVCLGALPVLLALAWWFRLRSVTAYAQVRDGTARMIAYFVETMRSIKAVQAYRREPSNQEHFEEIAAQHSSSILDTFGLVSIFVPGAKLVGNITTGVVLLYGGYRVLHGDMTIGTLTAFLLYLRMFFEPLQELTQFVNSYQAAESAGVKLSEALSLNPTVREPTMPRSLPQVRGDVQFRDVSFSYTPNHVTLSNFCLSIPAGQTLAVIGHSGAGKSTIAKLIARHYDPTAGHVLLDGINLQDIPSTELRRDVLLLSQHSFVFSGSIADNLRFGRPEANDAELQAAAEAIGAHTFIEKLSDGYETDVGKQGQLLSAGERQMLSLARAVLADPAVIVLDEATSSLDIPTERLVQQALNVVLADRTALVIAHRLSTVQMAERVLIIDDGCIVEDGDPDRLLSSGNSRYSQLHKAWHAASR